jgi:hypothetical protein
LSNQGVAKLVRFQVEGRLGEPGVAVVQQRRREQAQAADGPLEQVAYD